MQFIIGALVAVLLLAAPALAQDQKPVGPCERGNQQISFGGMDMDVIRCQVALDTQRLGELQSQLNSTTASLVLAKADLAKANEEAAKKQVELEWYKAAIKPLYEKAPAQDHPKPPAP